jgi:hypothetical protein
MSQAIEGTPGISGNAVFSANACDINTPSYIKLLAKLTINKCLIIIQEIFRSCKNN